MQAWQGQQCPTGHESSLHSSASCHALHKFHSGKSQNKSMFFLYDGKEGMGIPKYFPQFSANSQNIHPFLIKWVKKAREFPIVCLKMNKPLEKACKFQIWEFPIFSGKIWMPSFGVYN